MVEGPGRQIRLIATPAESKSRSTIAVVAHSSPKRIAAKSREPDGRVRVGVSNGLVSGPDEKGEEILMARMVMCAKLGREAEGFESPPFPGEFGLRIYENISLDAWDLWKEHQTILINHYGLHPADPETRKLLRTEMEEFFFGADARLPDGWAPPGVGAGAAPAQKKK